MADKKVTLEFNNALSLKIYKYSMLVDLVIMKRVKYLKYKKTNNFLPM